jgi:hypothetical protein
MLYFITTTSKDNQTLFLVDRTKVKAKWWSLLKDEAIRYFRKGEADICAGRIKNKIVVVVDHERAKELEAENNYRAITKKRTATFEQ